MHISAQRHIADQTLGSRLSRRRFVSGIAATAAAGSAIPHNGTHAHQASPAASPVPTRFGAVQEFLETLVAFDVPPGAVWLVSHHGEIETGTVGVMDFDSGEPMQRNTIFRIASMTKPVVGVAAMTLVDEGLIGLDDPVDPWLPELADPQVVRTLESPLSDTVPAEQPITLRDLLSFRMGIGAFYDVPPGTYPIQEAFVEAGLMPGPFGPPVSSNDAFMERVGSLPLAHHPGEVWRYHTGIDVAGVLISRITGGSLGDALRERIFAPLGMSDTGFWVPEGKIDRLATAYIRNPETQELVVLDPPRGGAWSEPPVFESGAGGLASTVDDYLAFGRMMLNGGRYDGGQILTDASFEEMTTDHLTPEQKADDTFFPGFWDVYGWGLGLSIVTAEGFAPGAGSIGWMGGMSTSWYSDPNEDLVGLLMLQVNDLPWFAQVNGAFWGNIYTEIAE